MREIYLDSQLECADNGDTSFYGGVVYLREKGEKEHGIRGHGTDRDGGPWHAVIEAMEEIGIKFPDYMDEDYEDLYDQITCREESYKQLILNKEGRLIDVGEDLYYTVYECNHCRHCGEAHWCKGDNLYPHEEW